MTDDSDHRWHESLAGILHSMLEIIRLNATLTVQMRGMIGAVAARDLDEYQRYARDSDATLQRLIDALADAEASKDGGA